jgi:hypothetical protein
VLISNQIVRLLSQIAILNLIKTKWHGLPFCHAKRPEGLVAGAKRQSHHITRHAVISASPNDSVIYYMTFGSLGLANTNRWLMLNEVKPNIGFCIGLHKFCPTYSLYSEFNASRNRTHKDAERSGAALCDPSLRTC